jgi:3-phenylpropionate/trans-cinnamate dioxygenase ferredoxin reductase component
MTTDRTLLIVGASVAGAKAAEGARRAGYDGRIVLVGAENERPYERPPLSKDVLRGEKDAETTRVHDEGYYDEHGIELLTGRTVTSLDLGAAQARLDGGETVGFTTAVLATGAEPRRLPLPGAELDGVHYLRTRADSLRLGDAIRGGGRVAVIGAGWIGSEVAASARQLGA